jgi:OOP family OmpA-OmpF porin
MPPIKTQGALPMNKILQAMIASSLVISSVNADEQPEAKNLVGKFYGGIHASMVSADDDRLNGVTSFEDDDSQGLGIEFGYRYSPELEVRLAYTDLTLDVTNTSSEVDGKAIAIDALYFPTQKNFYYLAGLNSLDIIKSQTSANAGIGYRHYFSSNFAAYTEAKTHYQLNDHHVDFTAQVGLVYFFGESKAPVKAIAPKVEKIEKAKVKAVTAITPVDTDKDGVYDKDDTCQNTPTTDKVDENGCTIFTEETLTQRLVVNFDNNSAVVTKTYYDEIEKAATFLKKYSHTSMEIGGHSSSQGSAPYNLSLSQKRADAVVAVLVTEFGIADDRLTAVGYGESKLVNTANTTTAHKENRRIEAVVNTTAKVPAAR